MTDFLRLDKWLWQARFFKSRSLASRFCETSRLRINEKVIQKAHQKVSVGDVLTFSRRGTVSVIEIKNLGTRRGPATEAVTLYKNLSELEISIDLEGEKISSSVPDQIGRRQPGSGRPTKADRRAMEKVRGKLLK